MLKPEARPNFSQLRESFEFQLEASVKDYYNEQRQYGARTQLMAEQQLLADEFQAQRS